jgi:NAD+ kinase
LTLKFGNATVDLVVKRIGILYHPEMEKAKALVAELEEVLSTGEISCWHSSAWDEDKARGQVSGSDLILSIGGDGTILHAARAIIPRSVPLLGINLGQLGFIAELNAAEALSRLPGVINGEGWLDDRAMLEADVNGKSLHALNDVVLRSSIARLIHITAKIDGEEMTTYRADGVVIASATGSTGYSLAVGGPILHPRSRQMILTPIACHLGLNRALVLPPESVVELSISEGGKAALSLDGQVNLPFKEGQTVTVKISPHATNFLRIHPPAYFYSTLWQKLKGKG